MKWSLLFAAVFSLYLFGCKNRPQHNISKPQAMGIAVGVARQHERSLQAYERPDVFFDAQRNCWIVTFSARKPYLVEPNDGFAIEIEGDTGTSTYKDRIWK